MKKDDNILLSVAIISYNQEKYFVSFREKPFASNVLPDIIVEVKGAENK